MCIFIVLVSYSQSNHASCCRRIGGRISFIADTLESALAFENTCSVMQNRAQVKVLEWSFLSWHKLLAGISGPCVSFNMGERVVCFLENSLW